MVRRIQACCLPVLLQAQAQPSDTVSMSCVLTDGLTDGRATTNMTKV